MTSYTFTVDTTDSAGDPVKATATITVTGNTMTIQLTDQTPNPTSDGQAITKLQLQFASAPPAYDTSNPFTQAGSLVDPDPANNTWDPVSGSPTHWAADAPSGNSILITSLSGGKPDDGIIDTQGGASNANSSFVQHEPEIADTGTFTLTFTGPPPVITGAIIGFGTAADTNNFPGAPCFLAGTRIAVSATETADIETLKAGDLVLTHDGRQVPVLWAGRHTVARRFADPRRVLPIRIAAGALGDGAPERDLLVSPCHALLIDGVLVQAGALVNGVSIRIETETAETFVYYHLETEDHSLIFAEGVPTETFIDNVSRMAFDNWDEHQALFPNGREIAELDLPRVTSARQLPAAIASRLSDFGAAA
jgi:hypothetical protein